MIDDVLKITKDNNSFFAIKLLYIKLRMYYVEELKQILI